jgi:comEA protein
MTRLAAVFALTVLASSSWLQAQEPARSAVSSPVINLNSATVPQLESLPGIGRATAERIVEYRQKNGGFKKVEDLMNVRGIGEKSFLKLKPLVSVGGPLRSDRTAP